MKSQSKTRQRRFVIVGNHSAGLYFGETDAADHEIATNKYVRLYNCQHIAKYYTKTGGITSLAAYGPCGPLGKESLVGAPADSLLTGVANVYDCSPLAIENFARIETKDAEQRAY